jgi:hypothetical protein
MSQQPQLNELVLIIWDEQQDANAGQHGGHAISSSQLTRTQYSQ